MPRAKEQTKVAPRAVRVFVHDHSKRHEPEHAATLGRYRMNMMENDTYADAGLKALQRFRQEQPEQGRRVEVEAIMDKDYWVCSLSESLETLQDGEPLHIFLTEPSSPALSQEAPKTPSASAKTKTPQSHKEPATPNAPRSAKGAGSSNPDRQTPASGRSRRSSTNAKETAVAPTPQIEISSDSGNTSHSGSEDTDCIFMGRTPDRTQKLAATPKTGGKPSQTPSKDGSGNQKVSSSLPANRAPIPAVQKQVSSSLPTDRTPAPAVKKLPPGHKHTVQPQEPKKPETSLPPNSSKSPRRTLPSSQNQQEPASSLQTATSVKADALPAKKADSKSSKSQPVPSRSSTSSSKSRNAQKDVYDVPSDTDGEIITPIITPVISPQQDQSLRARLRALQDEGVPSSPLPQKTADEQTASSRKQQSVLEATVIRDSDNSAPEQSDEEVFIVAKTPDSYTLKNTRGTHSVSRRKGHSSQREASDPSSSSVAAFPGSSPCARSSNRKSTDLLERLGEHNRAAKKRQEEEAAIAAEEAAEKEKAEAEARSKSISSREAIDQIKKMTNRKVEPKTLIEEIPDSFFEDTDLSDDHLSDDIIEGPSQSQSSFSTATPKDGTPRFEAKRRQPTPTTSFTPINTLYPKQPGQQNLGNATGKTFGLNYPKHFRDRFSDAEQSDEDDAASVGSEEEKFWRGEVLDDADGLPKAYKEYSWKYKTQFVSLGDRGYTYVGDGPWEGLILNGRHRGKYIFGCEPPNNAQIAEEEKKAEPRAQPSDWDESEADDNEDGAEQVELPPCSLPQTTLNSTTPTNRRQTAQDAKVSDESDLRSADSEASSVMIRKQLEAECPPSNQQLGIIMSSSPSKTPTGRFKSAPTLSASAGRCGGSPAPSEDDSEDTPKPISKLVVNNSGLSEGKKATIKKVTFSDQVEVEDDRGPILSPKPLAEVISDSSDAPDDDDEDEGDEAILPPKPLAEITGSEASDDQDAKEDSQASRASALKYVLRESPRWLNNLTTTNEARGSWKGLEQNSAASSSPSIQRQKSEPPSSSAPPRFRSYTPIPRPVIPTFTAATPSQPAMEGRKISNDFSSQRKRLASEPPKPATQTPIPSLKSFTPVPPPSIPQYPRSTPARSKLSVDNHSSQESSNIAAQKQPTAPETPHKGRDNLWDSIVTSSPALAATTSSKSSSKKHRRRDSESKHSDEPSEEPSSSHKKHKTKHNKKDKSARRESRHREEQQQDEHSSEDVVGVKTEPRDDASDADSVVTVLKHGRKDNELKNKKRKHRQSKSLDGSTTPRVAAQADADKASSHKMHKPSRKHRKSLDSEETPSRKKRKQSHGSHDAVAPVAAIAAVATSALNPTAPPLPPPAKAKRDASLSKPQAVVVKEEQDEDQKSKSPATFPNSIPALPRPNKRKKKLSRMKNRMKQKLSKTSSVSTNSPAVST